MKRLVVTRSIPLHPTAGGMERSGWSLVRGLAARGDVEVLTTPVPGQPQEFIHEGVRVRTVAGAKPGRYSFRWWWGTATDRRAAGADVVLSVSASATSMAWFQRGPSYAFQVHGTSLANARSVWRTPGRLKAIKVARSLWWVLVDLLTYRRVDQVIAVSEGVEQMLRRWPYAGAWRKTSLQMIPNGVDVERFRATEERRERGRARYGLADTDVVAITASRLDEQKAVDRAIDAVGMCSTAVHLLVAGVGPAERALRAQVDEAGLADRVTFAGLLDEEEVADALAAADVFVFPVRGIERESLPTMAVLEALASGLPVIVPAGSTWPADLAPLLDFVVVDDPDELAHAIASHGLSGAPRASRP